MSWSMRILIFHNLRKTYIWVTNTPAFRPKWAGKLSGDVIIPPTHHPTSSSQEQTESQGSRDNAGLLCTLHLSLTLWSLHFRGVLWLHFLSHSLSEQERDTNLSASAIISCLAWPKLGLTSSFWKEKCVLWLLIQWDPLTSQWTNRQSWQSVSKGTGAPNCSLPTCAFQLCIKVCTTAWCKNTMPTLPHVEVLCFCGSHKAILLSLRISTLC
jgi:hypothetical protein